MTTQPPAQELPELPKNVQHIMRRIRACEGEEAARIVLEHALREYGRACIAASQAPYGDKALNIVAELVSLIQAHGELTLHNGSGWMENALKLVLDEQEAGAASQAGRAEPVGEGFFMPDGTFSGSASKRLGYLRLLPEDAASGCTVRPLYATPPLEVRESAKCGYCGGSGSVNSWTTATSSDICFKCNGAGTATAKGE